MVIVLPLINNLVRSTSCMKYGWESTNRDPVNKKKENVGKKMHENEIREAVDRKIYQNERIRELRESLGLRRTEFGRKIGYTYQQIDRTEEGLSPVSNEMARRICAEYGVSEEWLSGEAESGMERLREDGREQRRKRLRKAYEDSGLSQREFARRTHSSVSVLKDVLAGRHEMTIQYAKKIEEFLGIGADWLLYGDEDAKECPCGDVMIRYLKKHPEIRREIWEKILADDSRENTEQI